MVLVVVKDFVMVAFVIVVGVLYMLCHGGADIIKVVVVVVVIVGCWE